MKAQNGGMLGGDRVGDRSSYAILTRNFCGKLVTTGENEDRARAKRLCIGRLGTWLGFRPGRSALAADPRFILELGFLCRRPEDRPILPGCRVALWRNRRSHFQGWVFALPAAAGLGLTRHPRMGAAREQPVSTRELIETRLNSNKGTKCDIEVCELEGTRWWFK